VKDGHTIATLADALRGILRDAPVYLRGEEGLLRRVTMVELIKVGINDQQHHGGSGQTAIVLRA
jgi:hypothetical protein